MDTIAEEKQYDNVKQHCSFCKNTLKLTDNLDNQVCKQCESDFELEYKIQSNTRRFSSMVKNISWFKREQLIPFLS